MSFFNDNKAAKKRAEMEAVFRQRVSKFKSEVNALVQTIDSIFGDQVSKSVEKAFLASIKKVEDAFEQLNRAVLEEEQFKLIQQKIYTELAYMFYLAEKSSFDLFQPSFQAQIAYNLPVETKSGVIFIIRRYNPTELAKIERQRNRLADKFLHDSDALCACEGHNGHQLVSTMLDSSVLKLRLGRSQSEVAESQPTVSKEKRRSSSEKLDLSAQQNASQQQAVSLEKTSKSLMEVLSAGFQRIKQAADDLLNWFTTTKTKAVESVVNSTAGFYKRYIAPKEDIPHGVSNLESEGAYVAPAPAA